MIASGLRQLAFIAGAIMAVATPWLVDAASDVAWADASANASNWDGDARSRVRLIAGQAPSGSALRAGIELKLSAGWKTYWRYPGDSGVPPRFDFSRSTNVRSVTVEWPAPHRFADGAGASIGYRDNVIFPLRIVPEDAAQPVMLRLNLQYAICEKVCVPVDASAELSPGRGASPYDTALASAEARVPVSTQLGAGKDLAIKTVARDPADKRRVVVDIAAPDNAKVDLFAEGPSPDWALPLPTMESGAPAGLRRFSFELDGLPPGAHADGAMLTLTATAGSRAIQVQTALD